MEKMIENATVIPFNMNLRPGKDSVEYFGEFYKHFDDPNILAIICDLCEYQYIHPSYAVLIASSIYLGRQKKKKVIIKYNKSNKKSIWFLSQSGMLKHQDLGKTSSLDENNVPFVRFQKFEETLETIQQILDCAPVKLDEKLSAVLISKIGEIFSNAFTHGRSEIGVFCCGFINDSNQFTFSVYDAGVGIPYNVSQYLGSEISPQDARKWAFEQGNSTLNGQLDYPRGAGLNLLESFVRVNGGRIELVSCGGYCRIENNQREFSNLKSPFVGTMFSMTIVADNNHIYRLK